MKGPQGFRLEAKVGIFGNIATGTKMASLAAHKDHPQAAIAVQLLKHLPQLAPHHARHRIHALRVAHSHQSDRPLNLADDFPTHTLPR